MPDPTQPSPYSADRATSAALPEAVSPTGQPLLPAAWVRLLLPIYVVASSGLLGALAYLYGADSKPFVLAGLAVSTLGSLIGVASPGLRRVVPALFLALTLSATACWFHPRPVLDCTAEKVADRWPGLLADVANILEREWANDAAWRAKLGEYLVAFGSDALKCALDELIGGLLNDSGAYRSGAPGVGVEVELARAQQYRATL